MRVIPPLEVTPARLTSSTVAEPAAGETAWNAATAYVVGDVAIRTSTHRRYVRLVDGTTATAPESDGVNWADDGPTLRYAMFDTLRNTASTAASPLTVVITPGRRVDGIALLGLVAQTAAITVTSASAGGTVYSNTVNLQTRDTGGWRDYFFGSFRYQAAIALFDLPLYTDAVITVTLSHASATVACGACVIGMSEYLGSTRLEAVSDVLNFSSVERDASGNAVMTQRRNVPVTKQKVFCDKALVPKARRVRDDLNATPAVWSALDDATDSDYFEAFLILGFARRFLINAEHPMQALIELELEEV